MAWAEVYFRTKWHLRPSSRLATIDMGRKPAAVHLFGELVPRLTQRRWAQVYLRRTTYYLFYLRQHRIL